MSRVFLFRILYGVITLWLVSVLVFVATSALPGDAALVILGRDASPELLANLREKLGLNDTLLSQYWNWLSSVVRLDFGESLTSSRPTGELLWPALGNSLFLMLCAAVIVTPLTMLLGVWSAFRRGSRFDAALSVVTLAIAGIPEFIVGIVLVVVFATTVMLLLPAVYIAMPGTQVWDHMDQLILPIATLVLATGPYMIRIMRANMIEVLESDYVQQGRLKGLPERTVLFRHALPNAAAPFVQVAALQFAFLLGGAVIVEYLFRFPGIGLLLINSINERDLPVVQAVSLVIAAFYVVINLFADVLTMLVNPRVRTTL